MTGCKRCRGKRLPEPGFKQCRVCKEKARKKSEEWRRGQSKKGLCQGCTEPAEPGQVFCKRHLDQRKRIGNAARRRASLKGYGLSESQLSGMYEDQGGKCEICGISQPLPDGTKRSHLVLNIDHCHVTGKVRGLLCFRCNVAVGHIEEAGDKLGAMLEYIAPR